jgi:type I restriction enzyme S subunit
MIRAGKAPEGYKQTKTGILPKEWGVVELNRVSDRIQRSNDGSNHPVLTISSSGGFLNQSERFSKIIAGENLKKYTLLYKDEFSYNKGNSKTYPCGCIFKLEEYETAVIPNVYYSFNIPNDSKEFYKHYFSSGKLNKQLSRIINTGVRNDGLLNLSAEEFFKCKIINPSFAEQQKIATILSTCDKAITLSEQLVEEKKRQKKGLMKKLITGAVRLSGFEGEWEDVQLGEVADMNSGGTPKSTVTEYYDGEIPWVSIADMTKKGKYIYSTERNISRLGLGNSSARLYPKETVLYAMYASIGQCSISKVELSSSQAILGIRPKSVLNNEFLYFNLLLQREKLKLQGQTGTQANLNAGMVKEIVIRLPDINEQEAIVSILLTSENEIELLESKLKSLKLQKKGLMQLLLTGIVRVPC